MLVLELRVRGVNVKSFIDKPDYLHDTCLIDHFCRKLNVTLLPTWIILGGYFLALLL